jgi:small subunit ribosomal protein S11
MRRRRRVRSAVKALFKKKRFRRRSRIPFRFRKKGRRIRKEKRLAASNKYKETIGRLLFRQSKNNLFFTMLDTEGHVYLTYSCGRIGLKGPRRGTPYAALQLGRFVAQKARKIALKCHILLRSGLNRHIRSALTGFSISYKREIFGIIDNIPRPHNGMRKKKKRNL